jgi:hypothetical protein
MEEVGAEERAAGMRLALETTRGLHDRVRLALSSLRMQGARLPHRLQQDVQALEAIRCALHNCVALDYRICGPTRGFDASSYRT